MPLKMHQQSVLKTISLPQTWLCLILAASFIGLLCLNIRSPSSSWQTLSDNLDTFRVRQYLIRRTLEENHVFVPANHSHLRVCFSLAEDSECPLTRTSVCRSLDDNIHRIETRCRVSRLNSFQKRNTDNLFN